MAQSARINKESKIIIVIPVNVTRIAIEPELFRKFENRGKWITDIIYVSETGAP